MNKENCTLKLVDEIILYYDARSKKHQITKENLMLTFLGALAKLRDATINFETSVSP